MTASYALAACACFLPAARKLNESSHSAAGCAATLPTGVSTPDKDGAGRAQLGVRAELYADAKTAVIEEILARALARKSASTKP